ncbi:hypothetical protein AA0242T_1155 [Acetobacter aceti NRIC 0242]|uniref:Uncharacterized protein n=1 Tax=Acetobacter aceti NBRC 14818 TaxID=887700 RepID=A0AB33ILX6_ACEAC|nr:hypothetical protein [Acetobacter aceti]TCS33354.1 hypothetical protein EDC15_10735 [Acetobacter aceti NBRC 14818]BCK77521.1 hypothetical protein EMQ_3127 [Acetobacter aceti NBRC 14818]GAN56840.1 hypothetical protein Abac_010_114 [Acetobacter aceti NBRC 14818]GBO80453.1 hypothetical protein AA0242T_1155 [Acetobacter aceti NRIC 0242]
MLIAADIILFLSLVWPFLAGAIIAAFGPESRTGDEETQSRFSQLAANFSLVAVALAALNVPLSLYLAATGQGVELGWMVEAPLATVGCLLLHVSLVSQCFAPPLPEEERALVARDAVPFWTTGLLALAMMLSEPVARAAMLLSAPVLSVILLNTGAGRALAGWNTLRRAATGALLVCSGFLHPDPIIEGMLAGCGFCLLASLFPCTLSLSATRTDRAGDASEILRANAATLAVVALLVTFPLPPVTALGLRGLFFASGLATLALAAVRLRLRSAPATSLLTQASMGLAAVSAGLAHPLVADLAVFGPLVATPWLSLSGKPNSRVTLLADQAFLLPGFAALLLAVMLVAGTSLPLALLLIAAVWPALRPGVRLFPSRVTLPKVSGAKPVNREGRS